MNRNVIHFIRYFALTTVVLAAGSSVLRAQAAPGGWTDFTKMFDASMERDHVVGSSILLLKDGNPVSQRKACGGVRACLQVGCRMLPGVC
jgi:hypothetical protein